MLESLKVEFGVRSTSWRLGVETTATFLRIASEMTETRFKSDSQIVLARLEDHHRFIITNKSESHENPPYRSMLAQFNEAAHSCRPIHTRYLRELLQDDATQL
jgi:hypothetical protein